jgi:hypothetical protein
MPCIEIGADVPRRFRWVVRRWLFQCRVGILPVVLDDVDVVRSGQQAGKGRRLGVPERSRNNALIRCQPERSARGTGEGHGMRTVLDEDVETLLDQEGRVKDDETITER